MATLEIDESGRKNSLMRHLPAFRRAAGLLLLAAETVVSNRLSQSEKFL